MKYKDKPKNKLLNIFKIINIATTLGFIISLPMIGFTFLGLFLDNKLNTKPILTILFLLAGTGIGFFSAVKEVRKNVF